MTTENNTTSSPEEQPPLPEKFDPEKHSLVIFKPDSIQRGLWGYLINRFHESELYPVCGVLKVMTDTEINMHYAAHLGKDFFPRLAEFMVSGPSLIVLMKGNWNVARSLMMQLRTQLKTENPKNLIHTSDSPEAVERETRLWFRERC